MAYTNVTRTGSGLFVVGLQLPCALAGTDTIVASASAFSAPASGGVASGQWFVEQTGHLITAPPIGDVIGVVSAWQEQAGAGNLTQTPTVMGICPAPIPMGDEGAIVFFVATTSGAEAVTPSGFFAYAFELP